MYTISQNIDGGAQRLMVGPLPSYTTAHTSLCIVMIRICMHSDGGV